VTVAAGWTLAVKRRNWSLGDILNGRSWLVLWWFWKYADVNGGSVNVSTPDLSKTYKQKDPKDLQVLGFLDKHQSCGRTGIAGDVDACESEGRTTMTTDLTKSHIAECDVRHGLTGRTDGTQCTDRCGDKIYMCI
jgi:hypothetical protein